MYLVFRQKGHSQRCALPSLLRPAVVMALREKIREKPSNIDESPRQPNIKLTKTFSSQKLQWMEKMCNAVAVSKLTADFQSKHAELYSTTTRQVTNYTKTLPC